MRLFCGAAPARQQRLSCSAIRERVSNGEGDSYIFIERERERTNVRECAFVVLYNAGAAGATVRGQFFTS